MQDVLKRTAESMLVHLGPAAISRRHVRHRSLILAYHNILPEGPKPSGDKSLHLSVSAFQEQLAILSEQAEVVPLMDVLSQPGGTGTRPRVALTFDDAYRGALSVGLAQVRERGWPMTVFVAPRFLGGSGFWWDELSAPGEDAGFADHFRQHALNAHRGMDASVREWALATGGRQNTAAFHAKCVTEEELAEALTYPQLTLGSHSWSHPNLARLELPELEAELRRSLEWLERFPGRHVPVISYPYGLSSPQVERSVRAAGYMSGLRVQGGWCPARLTALYAVPRLNVPSGLSGTGFELRLAGLFC